MINAYEPDWSEAPEWAMYYAVDSPDGDVDATWYEHEPKKLRRCWARVSGRAQYVCMARPLWETSLRKRPETTMSASDWTHVSAAMPEPGVIVLAHYRNEFNKGRRIRAEWLPAKTRELYDHEDEDWGEYDEDAGTYWAPEGWYECTDNWDSYSSVFVVEGDVTHWMPMPPAPVGDE